MTSGEPEHPLRADPLQSLPDALSVPRRPRTTTHSSTLDHHGPKSSQSTPNAIISSSHASSQHHSSTSSPSPILMGPSVSDQRSLERETLRKFQNSAPSDPLQAAIMRDARDHATPSPPAGHAFASDVDAYLSSLDVNAHHGSVDSTSNLTAPHAVLVTLSPAPPTPGAAAGVYILRTRLPRRLRESTPGSYSPSSDQSPTRMPSKNPRPHSNQQSTNLVTADGKQKPSSSTFVASNDDSVSLAPNEVQVRRTLADFSWLSERLTARYDGVIVPLLPEMSLGGRMTYGYAYDKQRARGLQRFLQQVASHPVLAAGEEVSAFLGATGEAAWSELRRQPVATEPSVADRLFAAERGRNLSDPMQRIGVWRDKLLWKSGKRFNDGLVWFLDRDRNEPTQKPQLDSAQARLDRLHKYVKGLTASLADIRDAAARVSRSRFLEEESARALQESLKILASREGGKFASVLESVALDISSGCENMGSTESSSSEGSSDDKEEGHNEDMASSPGRGESSATAIRLLVDVLGDLEERAHGAQRIMAARQEEHEVYERALKTYTTLRDKLDRQGDTVSASNSQHSNSTNSGNRGAVDELVERTEAAAARLADVRRHYHIVAVRTTDELRRLRAELHSELSDGLIRVADRLVNEHSKHAQAWTSVAESLRDIRGALMHVDGIGNS